MAKSRTDRTNPIFAEPLLGIDRDDDGLRAPLKMGPATATLVWLATCAGMWLLVSELATAL
ncbi:MAG: hypothetical protein ACREER_12755 [Alphaproteobacteria bacterium]